MAATATQIGYYSLNLAGGAVALPVLLLTTALSRNVKKQPVLINMYIACIYEAMLACILWVGPSVSAPIKTLIANVRSFFIVTP
jgi:hypothetical protein